MKIKPMVLVHGGAATQALLTVDGIPKETIEKGIRDSVMKGWEALKRGGSAVDAVEAAVMKMERDPTFNAGRGSFFTKEEEIEMDAAIQDGATLKAGGVSCIYNVAHPIKVARAVMEKSRHVLYVGRGAKKFADEHGFKSVSDEYLITEKAENRFEEHSSFKAALEQEFYEDDKHLEADKEKSATEQPAPQKTEPVTNGTAPTQDTPPCSLKDHDTVGAVAIDADGNVAFATSTGGINAKDPGRCGDSCNLGQGGYADNSVGAISTTGHGESIMKAMLAARAYYQMRDGKSPQEALEESLEYMLSDPITGKGGAIAVNNKGDFGIYNTTEAMVWAYVKEDVLHYGMYPEEDFTVNV